MPDRNWLESIVERIVTEALESHASQLRTDIVRRVIDEVGAQLESARAAASTSGTADLARAISDIQVGTSQKEILRALLDVTAQYAARAALFVVKGGHATGWQARGFRNRDGIKDFSLDSTNKAVMRAITERVAASTPVADFDAHFLDTFGKPASDHAHLLPLILKDKVAALVYADGGPGGGNDQTLDPGALEVLVLATSSWLEVNALRKQAHKEPEASSVDAHAAPAPSAAPAYNDPFAGHAPAYAMAAAASADSSAPAPMQDLPSAAAHATIGDPPAGLPEMQASAAAAAPAADPLPVGQVATEATAEASSAPAASGGMSPEDQDVHRKAQRFARLLVDEIKLYNQAKVSEGRKKKDLYDRLKEAIEKSRSTYQKRYGNTVAASGNYFQHEVIRSLAEDDVSLMGANFKL